jgi:transposase-like protein
MQAALDALLSAPMTGGEVNDLTARLKRAILERALNAEMSLHLGYASGEDKPAGAANHRNGTSGKTLLTDTGALRIDIPRDRTGAFEPLIVPKHGRRCEVQRGVQREYKGDVLDIFSFYDILPSCLDMPA